MYPNSLHYYRYRSHVEKNLKYPVCGESEEDEVHFVVCCLVLDDLRKQFIPPKFCKHPCIFRLSLLLASTNLETVRKLSIFFCVWLSKLGILLLLSTNEPDVVNSCHLYDARLNFSFFLFNGFVSNCICTPF